MPAEVPRDSQAAHDNQAAGVGETPGDSQAGGDSEVLVATERLETPPSQEKPGSLMARLRQNARWGLLPRKVTEALASSDKEAPAEYKEIIARYYKRMTEYYDRNR